MSFSQVPADVRRKIALDLSPVDLIQLCSSEKMQMRDICNSDDFWRQKLEKDYHGKFNEYEYKNTPKETYIKLFRQIFVEIEKFIDEILDFFLSRIFRKYLNESYKKDLSKHLYKTYLVFGNFLKDNNMDVSQWDDMIDELYDTELIPFIEKEGDNTFDHTERFIKKLVVDYFGKTRNDETEVDSESGPDEYPEGFDIIFETP